MYATRQSVMRRICHYKRGAPLISAALLWGGGAVSAILTGPPGLLRPAAGHLTLTEDFPNDFSSFT